MPFIFTITSEEMTVPDALIVEVDPFDKFPAVHLPFVTEGLGSLRFLYVAVICLKGGNYSAGQYICERSLLCSCASFSDTAHVYLYDGLRYGTSAIGADASRAAHCCRGIRVSTCLRSHVRGIL
jgi:hypothetical protein